MTIARAIGETIAMAGVGYIVGEMLASPVHQAAGMIPLPVKGTLSSIIPHHYEIGSAIASTGVFTKRPVWLGMGIGLMLSDRKDLIGRKNRIVKYTTGVGEMVNIETLEIPNWVPPKIRYGIIGKKFVELARKPTWNSTNNSWIPAGREHPAVITQARMIANEYNVDGRDRVAILKAVQHWMQRNIRYVHDPRGFDTFYHPYRTLQIGAGDCDDQAILAASLCEALAVPMAFLLLAQRHKGIHNHVITGGYWNGRFYPIETIRKVNFGYMPRHISKRLFII